MRKFAAPLLAALAALVVPAGCGGDDDSTTGEAPSDSAEFTYRERVITIGDWVDVWEQADSIAVAHAAAENAANLIVGPNGPGYGDRDGNGSVGGETTFGLLPGLDGTPPGLAETLADNACIVADVLGGPWDDPSARWAEMETVVASWTPDDNTMPQLASHPMRIVGWATLTLASDSLDAAHEYGGHAQLHVTAATDALDCPTS